MNTQQRSATINQSINKSINHSLNQSIKSVILYLRYIPQVEHPVLVSLDGQKGCSTGEHTGDATSLPLRMRPDEVLLVGTRRQCGIAIEVILSVVHLWITRGARVTPVELSHIDITP